MKTLSGELELQIGHQTPSSVYQQLGLNQGIDFYQINQYGGDSMAAWIKLRGMSIKDFLTLMGSSGTEEQMKILLREHYEDKTEDNPYYNWINIAYTEEPIDDRSVDLDGMYLSVIFDAEVDFKINVVPLGFALVSLNDKGETLAAGRTSFDDLDNYPYSDRELILDYTNNFLNLVFFGGLKETKYDIYSKKGFHKFDGMWKSLEEEMNIPKVVEKHSDLPKSFIENGIMVVTNQEEIIPEPTTKLDPIIPVSVKVNPTPSVKDEIEKLKDYFIQNGDSSDVDWDNCYISFVGSFMNEDGDSVAAFILSSYMTDNGVYGIEIRTATPEDTILKYLYFDEGGVDIYIPGVDQNSDGTIYTTNEGGWYCMEVYLNSNDEEFLKTPIKKIEFEDEFVLSDDKTTCSMFCMYEDENGNHDKFEEFSYEFASIFRVYDESEKIVYPKGFYMYAKNHWWYQPEISGESFDNADILKLITAEDVGSFHHHKNQAQLNQIDAALLNRITTSYLNTHDHSNKLYLDKITSDDNIHIHSNKETLDKLEYFKDLLVYSGKVVGAVGKQILSADDQRTYISIDPNTFYEIKLNSSCAELRIILDCPYQNLSLPIVQEHKFSIDTSGITNDVELQIQASDSWQTIHWISERIVMLSPNKYYEFSIVDFKVIYISTEVGGN